MKAIIKRNLKNYLKNPIFWIGLIVVLISMYQTLAPYLSIHYVKSDETFRKVKMASDGDVMEGFRQHRIRRENCGRKRL